MHFAAPLSRNTFFFYLNRWHVVPIICISLQLYAKIQIFFLIIKVGPNGRERWSGPVTIVFRCKSYVGYVFFKIFNFKNDEKLTRVHIVFLVHFAAN